MKFKNASKITLSAFSSRVFKIFARENPTTTLANFRKRHGRALQWLVAQGCKRRPGGIASRLARIVPTMDKRSFIVGT